MIDEEIIFIIVGFFLFLVAIGFGIGYLIRRVWLKKRSLIDREWYLQLAFSKEDAVGQWLFVLAWFFLMITLTAIKRQLSFDIDWTMILLFGITVGIVVAYYYRLLYLLILSALAVFAWLPSQFAQWMESVKVADISILSGLALLTLLFYSLGRCHLIDVKFKRVSTAFIIIGLLPLTLIMFILSTKSGLEMLDDLTGGKIVFASWRITLVLGVLLASVLTAIVYSSGKKLMNNFEAILVLALAVFFSILVFFPDLDLLSYNEYSYRTGMTATGGVWASILNLLAFGEILTVIFIGYTRREIWMINLGALFLLIMVLIKYFDWFFSFLDKSIFFIGAGILLLVVGFFMEKGRRYMLSNIQKPV